MKETLRVNDEAGADGKPCRTDGSLTGAHDVRWLLIGAVIAMVALRVVCLQSDAYPRLSWSTALLTDEGFYIHNARNLVLFGRERLDGWNNMLIMPLLHVVQIGVFRIWGVGAVQARSISIVTSLLTVALFYDAARRSWGRAVAGVAALFLGLDHVNLLYNRLAFMDTPCVLVVVAAWWASLRGYEQTSHVAASAPATAGVPVGGTPVGGSLWYAVAGVCGVAAYAVRGLAALVIWLPLVFALDPRRQIAVRRPHLLSFVLGTALGAASYLLLWARPHQAELAFVNHYYLTHQLVPHDLRRLLVNIGMSFGDWQRGIFPYLARHTPVQCLFALVAMWNASRSLWRHRSLRGASGGDQGEQRPVDQTDGDRHPGARKLASCSTLALMGWLLILWAFCCTVNYSPSRYYVLFYPALAGLAATGLFDVRRGAGNGTRKGKRTVALALGIWTVINGLWLLDWLTHLTYRQQAADRWLAQHLPPDSVLLGAIAPGLCLNNRLHAWNMIEFLCNDDHPIEQLGTTPGYIVMIDEANWTESWWPRHYPALVARPNRIHVFHGLLRPFFAIGLYPANQASLRKYKEMRRGGGENDR